MGPTGKSQILQIHPTRRCNLRCLHCYSSSGPGERDELPAALLRDALTDARAEGYNVAAISGGEPVLYKPLRGLLEHARRCGMLTTVTSNGMLLDQRRLETLRDVVDLLAISLDGVPDSHNQMRADGRAFAAMAVNLEGVRESGIPFGFIFTLTQHNLHELPWVMEFAVGQGARLLQIHPLEEVGRAKQLLEGERPDEIEASFAFLAVAQLQEVAGARLYLQLDLLNRDYLSAQPERALAGDAKSAGPETPLAQLVSPLVVEADGTVVPLQYGFPRDYALGNLREAPLRGLMAHWRCGTYPRFHRLCRHVFDELTAPAELPLTNWYERVALRAREPVTLETPLIAV